MEMDVNRGLPYMLSVEEAQARILGMFRTLESERKPLLDALGQVLAEDVVSTLDIPPLTNSAMDGYAVRYEAIAGATYDNPRELRVIGHLAAGQLPEQEVSGVNAVRIMTGAPIPSGADTVVPFEETDEYERKSLGMGPLDITEIMVRTDVPRGANLRPAGQDVQKGQMVLEKGALLRPSEIGVLASLGRDTVEVTRRPVVAVIATGDELLEPGEPPAAGKIYNSNSYSVAAAVLRYGGIPRMLGIAGDNLESMNAKLEEGLTADMLLTSAGVSRGDYDIVKDVLASRGEIDFWSVRMRPAKPLAFGVFPGPGGRKVPHIGLPGNPVSALVAFEEMVRPAILKMQGRTDLGKPVVRAALEDDIVNGDERRVYARAVITRRDGRYYARLTGDQGSGVLTSMALANGLAICPEDVPVMKAGEEVDVQMLDWPEDAGQR
jgi:molybdopterin molybdotransferase